MNIPGSKRARLVVKYLRRRLVPHGIILMYHRVGERGNDPWGMCVTSQHFDEQMAVLRAHGRTLSLSQLVAAQQRGTLPNKVIAVTFDDGYADNLLNARPLLNQYEIPATVFVTSGQVGSEREFWWDELERLLLQPGQLPQMLHLEINHTCHQWNLDAAALYSKDDCQRDRKRLAWEGEPGSRLAFYYLVWSALRPLPHAEQQSALETIRCWAGAEKKTRSTYRSLTSDELQRLSQENLVEIGAHTVTHPTLIAHASAYQRNEVLQSKAQLEEVLNRRVISFSYPFGDFSTETATIVPEAGFASACTTQQGLVWPKGNCYCLPRFEVRDWNGDEFAERLSSWL